jgi:ferredoxin
LAREALDDLIQRLRSLGYTVIGPTLVDDIVSMREINSVRDLPMGVRDRQRPGQYRLEHQTGQLLFDYVVGPDGVKRYLFPPTQPLMRFHVRNDRFDLDSGPPQVPKLALFGIRPCELAAMKVQDRVFAYDDPRTFRCESEPWYTQVRQESVYIAVNCTRPGGTCFCASWETGPEARSGYDLALTELRDGFVVAIGSQRGTSFLEGIAVREPTEAELELAELKIARARDHMQRRLDTTDLKQLLDRNIEHPAWDEISKRCLACGNCTMVCPTCFCSTVSDTTDLTDDRVTRTREWESCFTLQFSYTVGGPGRNTVRGRYRQWLRHKLCTWWDQFGSSGCVGCGRCITWCPVGIDLTQEVRKIRETSGQSADPSTTSRRFS